MKTTPFTEKHVSLGAKMHEFAGYNMPIEYSGIIDEHLTVCGGVGVFDVSHMGEFWVKGPHALDFLQKVTSNNVAALTPGKVQYTCFPNEDGGIVDDLLVYHYEPEKYLRRTLRKTGTGACLITRKALNWKMLPTAWHSLPCKDRRLFWLCRS